jgi:hypothetical protein
MGEVERAAAHLLAVDVVAPHADADGLATGALAARAPRNRGPTRWCGRFSRRPTGNRTVVRIGMVAMTLSLLVGESAAASITVATNVQRPALRVDARGYAEVSWTAAGRRQYLLVPPTGLFLPGGRLSRPDVSRANTAVAIPYRRVLRRTPDGRYWALQTWQVGFSKVIELRFSRWRGAPTHITLASHPSGETELLRGRATFQGRPVTGYSPTNAGKLILHSAFLDCFACGSGWLRFTARRTSSDGSFSATVPLNRRGTRYRVSITGPNRGATLAPDAAAVTPASAR